MSRNQYLDMDIIGIDSPLTFNPNYQNVGMTQQLIDLITEEELSPIRQRLFLDEMSPACRISLYKCLKDLQGAAVDVLLITNPGGPFTATTGYTEQGAEAAAHAISEDNTSLIGTMTAGTEGTIGVSTPVTTVIGVKYRAAFTNLDIATDGNLRASNAAALSAPIASTALESADAPFASASVEFTATATTTYVGVNFLTSIETGIQWQFDSLSVVPIVPVP